MAFLTSAYAWIMDHGPLFAGLFVASEALGGIPAIKSNSVYQVVLKVLGFMKDKTAKPAA